MGNNSYSWLIPCLEIHKALVMVLLLTGLTVGSEQKLYEDLFANYNRKVRPVKNFSHPITVYFNIKINQISDMDERNQILKINAWTEQEWWDEIVVWDPDDYDGLSEIRIPATELWLPDITLYNNADSHDYVAENNTASNAVVESDGHVRLRSKPTLLKSTCKIYVKYFPFDVQACRMKFGSWTYDSFQINLTNSSTEPDLHEYVRNEQWALVHAQTDRHVLFYECCPERYIDVTFSLCLRRKPMYYIYNLIIPCVLLCALALTGFFMPYSVGVVKASISVTLILSLTVFLLLVAEMMPRTSEEIPLIGQYYLATMCLISLSTGMNVAVLNVHGCKREVPKWINVIVLKYVAFLVCMGKCAKDNGEMGNKLHKDTRPIVNNLKHSPIPQLRENSVHGIKGSIGGGRHTMSMHSMREMYDDSDDGDGRFGKIEHYVDQIFKHLKTIQRKNDRKTLIREQWCCVAAILDKALMYLFFISTLITSLVLLLQDPGDSSNVCSHEIEHELSLG
ncbi:neuronal acetylcholine receptor subunit alpha-10-like isoform X2 [Ptychodera flava]|uniref:neuronal acetylcholine receptor subunit alpha-10-like isoform X2 n=1 Tax=Ptychodera flava TaxID=63121 RepID=UPI00396A1A7D